MIPKELARKIRYIQIYTSKAVNDVLAGEYHSVFKGRGMEFDEVREYTPGDEIRTIDWNVTARMGHPFVKRYVEERELTVLFLVDLSASGTFGSVDKLKNEVAAELCALLAFSAIKNNDKVGLIVFTDTIELFIPAARATRPWPRGPGFSAERQAHRYRAGARFPGPGDAQARRRVPGVRFPGRAL